MKILGCLHDPGKFGKKQGLINRRAEFTIEIKSFRKSELTAERTKKGIRDRALARGSIAQERRRAEKGESVGRSAYARQIGGGLMSRILMSRGHTRKTTRRGL